MTAKYALDTCAILETWRRNFPRDVVPGLWERLEALIDDGLIVAPDEVFEELTKKDDEVLAWAKLRKQRMFVPIDDDQVAHVSDIVNSHPNILKTGRNRADPFVVALAQARGLTVVTEEGEDGSERKPKIPFICALHDVRCINVVGLMREQGWTLR